MLDIINNVWISGLIPDDLKHSIIIPMIKLRKDPLHPNSYRPISLTSCFCKVMERMVNQRLTYYLEKNKLLPNIQCGFRRNRSATDHLTRLSDSIFKTINNNKKSVATFIDLNKAFDRLDYFTLSKKLQNLNITGNIYRYIVYTAFFQIALQQ